MTYQPAVLNTARLNNFRLAYLPADLNTIRGAKVGIWIGGVLASTATSARRVRVGSVTIRDVVNDAPNTATFVCQGVAPVEGQTVRVVINSNAPRLLFAGTIQTVTISYEGRPGQVAWSCTAIDDTASLNRRRPFGMFTDASATAIAQALAAEFAPGFTTRGVAASLPAVSITFDGTDDFIRCLTRLSSLIGGYCYVEDRDVHLFLEETGDTPDPIVAGARFLDDPPISAATDLSQLQTRIYGKGHGEPVLSDVAAGETLLPLADAVMFNAAGGRAIAGTTPDGAQAQRLTYAGIDLGGAGSLVGPGVTPAAALVVGMAAGAGIDAGAHNWAYSWVTAAGETLPGPLAALAVGPGAAIAAPAAAPVIQVSTYSGFGATWPPGSAVYAVVTYANALGETVGSAVSNTVFPGVAFGGFALDIDITALPVSPDPAVTIKYVYLNVNGAWDSKYSTHKANAVHFHFQQTATFVSGAAAPPATNTTAGSQATIAGVAVGPTGTTARKVYRTAAGGSQLKLQQTIANNTATTGTTDATPDASLGANAPAGDTSGLSTTPGQVNPGSTSILTASAAVFRSSGGWALLSGQQVVRYAGISGNTLTGIPAAGAGAIRTAVPYGNLITAAPLLVGVAGLGLPMQRGAVVHIWIQRDDLAAQADQAAIDASNGLVPADGIYEGPIVVDERRGEASLTALCDATLALFARPLVTITYDTRDTKTKSGKPIAVLLASPAIDDELTIQSVDVSELETAPGLLPRFHVTASSVRVSLDDLLRRLLAAQGAT